MTTVFVSIPMKERTLGHVLIEQIEAAVFDVLSPLGEESPAEAPPEEESSRPHLHDIR